MNDFTQWLNNQHEQYIDQVAQNYPNMPMNNVEYYSEGRLDGGDNPEILEEEDIKSLKEQEDGTKR